MPKTWKDGPPRTRLDSWKFERRSLISIVSGNILLTHLAEHNESWSPEPGDEEIDRYAALGKRAFELWISQVPRTDGKTWGDPPDTEEDTWAWSRFSAAAVSASYFLVRKLAAVESWQGDEFSDEVLLSVYRLVLRIEGRIDLAEPRVG